MVFRQVQGAIDRVKNIAQKIENEAIALAGTEIAIDDAEIILKKAIQGWRTSQAWTFQPQASNLDPLTPDFSTMNFLTMNF